jgi:hypothetical protein
MATRSKQLQDRSPTQRKKHIDQLSLLSFGELRKRQELVQSQKKMGFDQYKAAKKSGNKLKEATAIRAGENLAEMERDLIEVIDRKSFPKPSAKKKPSSKPKPPAKRTPTTPKNATKKKPTAKAKAVAKSTRKPKVMHSSTRQTGKRKSVKRDKALDALPPGKRISRTGRVYYEYRRNRTDAPGKRI